jgi:hypothetical protein
LNSIHINPAELANARKALERAVKEQSGAVYNSILRKATRGMIEDMKRNAPTADNDNVERNIAMTTSKKYTHGSGVRVGVVRNNTVNLPNFSAQALASVLEYGSIERVRSTGGSTGSVASRPWLRPAYDRHAGQVIKEVEAEVERIVQEAMR